MPRRDELRRTDSFRFVDEPEVVQKRRSGKLHSIWIPRLDRSEPRSPWPRAYSTPMGVTAIAPFEIHRFRNKNFSLLQKLNLLNKPGGAITEPPTKD